MITLPARATIIVLHRRIIFAATAIVILSGLSGLLSVQAKDWPQWRGPNRDGVWTESGILTSFPSTGLVPKWKIPVGFGYSSPIISNGKIYLSDLVVEKPLVHERVLCFNARSGKRLWMTQFDATPPDWFFVPDQMRGPGPTPIIQNGRVYTIGMFTKLQCLDARTGAVLWKHDLTAEYQLPPSSLDASPLIDGNLLIVSIGGKTRGRRRRFRPRHRS
jgi:outer membrane protein assembly factor BamB